MGGPVIALTGRRLGQERISGWTKDAYASPEGYALAIAAAGGVPLIAPPVAGADVGSLAEACAGLVLTGGPDVDPALFGEDAHPATYGVDREIDEFEAGLAVECMRRGRPVLAICRGMQLLNVVLGGTLVQHVDDHGDPPGGSGGVLHEVSCSAGSLVAK